MKKKIGSTVGPLNAYKCNENLVFNPVKLGVKKLADCIQNIKNTISSFKTYIHLLRGKLIGIIDYITRQIYQSNQSINQSITPSII